MSRFTLATLFTVFVSIVALYWGFIVAPSEQVMGAVQRIFYFHVGSAIACYLAFGIVFLASMWFFASREKKADYLNAAAAEVGFVFCSITLFSGMIWGKAAWNTWFRWEPRLVTFLLLWLIFLGFLLLRRLGERSTRDIQSAVIGILGSMTVPLVWLSVKFLSPLQQLHPQVIEKRGLTDSRYEIALLFATIACCCWCGVLTRIRYQIETMSEKRR